MSFLERKAAFRHYRPMNDKRPIDKARGARIKFLRNELLGLGSQDAFASWLKTKVTRGAVGNWEQGKDIGLDALKQIAIRASQSQIDGVTVDWLLTGAGDSPSAGGKPDLQYTPNPDSEVTHDFDHDEAGAGFVDGKVVFRGRLPSSQPETSAKGGLGQGQIPDSGTVRIQSNGIASGHSVVAEWVIPAPYLRSLGGAPDTTIIVPVLGHSMEPRLVEGDRVIIDVSQNTWVADAIYAIDDGDANLQIKTLRKVTSSSPPVFRIISENPPGDEVNRRHDEFRIVGRVVGRISKP